MHGKNVTIEIDLQEIIKKKSGTREWSAQLAIRYIEWEY